MSNDYDLSFSELLQRKHGSERDEEKVERKIKFGHVNLKKKNK
jgi:hypothetical protein